MKIFFKINITILSIIMLLCMTVVSTSALSTSASLAGPEKIDLNGNLEINYFLNGSGENAVTGQIVYDVSLLLPQEVISSATGWKIESTIDSDTGTIYFAAADESNKNPVKTNSALFKIVFSKKYLEGGNKVTVQATNLTASLSKGKEVLSDCSYTGVVSGKETNLPLGNNEENDLVENSAGSSLVNTDLDPLDQIRLKKLSVKEAKMSPEFDPDTKSYKIYVSDKQKSITVSAEPQDPESKVTVSDTKLSKNVKNITKVVVEAKNGSKRTYKIYSFRKSETSQNEADQASSSTLKIIIISVCALIAIVALLSVLFLLLKKGKGKTNKTPH